MPHDAEENRTNRCCVGSVHPKTCVESQSIMMIHHYRPISDKPGGRRTTNIPKA